MPGLQLGAEWRQRQNVWRSKHRPFSTHRHCLLAKGEAGPPGGGPTQALGATSSLLGLCLIQAKLSEMEEVKPAR